MTIKATGVLTLGFKATDPMSIKIKTYRSVPINQRRLSREVSIGEEGGRSAPNLVSVSGRRPAPLACPAVVAKPNRGSRGRAGPQVRCRRLLPVDSPFYLILPSEANILAGEGFIRLPSVI